MVGEALPQLLTDTVSTVVLVVEEVEGVVGMVVVEQEVSQDAQNIEVSISEDCIAPIDLFYNEIHNRILTPLFCLYCSDGDWTSVFCVLARFEGLLHYVNFEIFLIGMFSIIYVTSCLLLICCCVHLFFVNLSALAVLVCE